MPCSTCPSPHNSSTPCPSYTPSTTPPYTVQYNERCGRLLVAGRAILAGEEIFSDSPAAMGPDNNPRPVCLVCYTRLGVGRLGVGRLGRLGVGQTVWCRGCGWPLCSEECGESVGQHARECQLFQIHSTRFNIDDYKATCPSYNTIIVLRLLWLRDNEHVTWGMIDMLMDHLEDDKELTKPERAAVDFIRNHCKLKQFSEGEILHIMGIVDTNSYIIGENPNKNVDLQGLFPITSIINHSCMANTVCFARQDFSFVCRAVTDIEEGEELTTNYLYYSYHFFGLSYRAPELEDFWHFKCTCARCSSCTELGTLADSLLCTGCVSGRLTPLAVEEQDSDWVCRECGTTRQARVVANTVNHWWNVIEEAPKNDVTVCMELLDQLGGLFDQNHYYVMEIKRRVVENIGNTPGFEYQDLAVIWLQKKVEFCKEHLSLQKVLAPGLSEYRAYISLHLAEAMFWLAKKKYLVKQMTRELVIKTMEEVSEHLLIVIDIWGLYRRGSSERMRAEEAQSLLEKVNVEFLQDGVVETADLGLVETVLEMSN